MAGLLLLPGCLLIDGLDGNYAVQAPTTSACSGDWSDSYGGEALESAGGIAINSAARLFAVGAYSGALVVGQETITATSIDSYLIALDNEGNVERAFTTGFVGDEKAQAVAADTDLVVLAGTYGMGFDGCSGADDPGNAGIFVSFITAGSLALEQTRCFPSDGAPEVTGIAVDEQGARVVGVFDGELVHEGIPYAAEEQDGFMIALDRSAVVGALVRATGAGDQSIDAVAVLPGGRTAIAGTFGDELLVLGESRAPVGGDDIFLSVLDASLGLRSLQTWGNDEDQQATGIAFDAGEVLLAGEHDEGTLDFGPDAQVTAPPGETVAGFAVSFPFDDGSGVLGPPRWVTAIAAEDLDVRSIAVSQVAVYLGGTLDGALAVAGGAPEGTGSQDIFVVRLDRATGAPRATSRCGDADVQRLAGLAVDREDDEVFFVAELSGSIDLGGLEQHSSQGSSDLLVGQLATPE